MAINYIVLAEFDIDKGSGVRIQYPEAVPNTNAEELAEYMITEGAHNFGVVTTYFSVGKRPFRELEDSIRLLSNPQNHQTIFMDNIFTTEMKQRLLEKFWIPQEQQGQSFQGQQVRSLCESMKNLQASNIEGASQAQQQLEQLRYNAQKVKLYRIENMQWKPYFQQGRERLVEFQLTCQNSQIFTIKLVADPQDSTSPLLAQQAKVKGAALLLGGSNQAAQANQNDLCIEIKAHPFLNFTAKEADPFRASFENKEGYIYGIEVVNENVEERFNLYQLMKQGLGYDPYRCFEFSINQSQKTIYFQNILKNRHDKQVKRGAIVKALAFGCTQKVLLEPLSQLIEATLDQIISMTDLSAPVEANIAKYQQLISEVYLQANQQSVNFLAHRGNFIQRAVSLDLSTNCAWRATNKLKSQLLNGGQKQDALYQVQELQIPQIAAEPIPIAIPLASPPDTVTSSSLINLVRYFGHQVMVIYDAILSDKRIIFAGSRNMSITQIQNYLFAAASMVSPPLYGIHNKILPYVPLTAMGTLTGDEGFLAGVTNPMFLENRGCYDVSVRIEQNKLNADSKYQREPYYELDMEFIKTLLNRIQTHKLNDEEIRQAFHSYTQLMLDMSTNLSYNNSPDSAGMTHKGTPLSQLYLTRTRRLKNTHLFRTHHNIEKIMDHDKTQGISLGLIKQHMRTLRIKGIPSGPLSDFEANNIFKDVDAFLQDESSAIKLLYMLPLCRQGVGLIAHGLFYDDERVQHMTVRILTKFERSCKAGALAVSRLSDFFKMRLCDLRLEMQEMIAQKFIQTKKL